MQILKNFLEDAGFALAALVPIMNPPGMAPIFLAMTADLPTQIRNNLAARVALNGWLLLVGSIFLGSYVLHFFGISLPAVKVGGGLLVMATGWRILNSNEQRPLRTPGESKVALAREQAFYPLAFPLTVGPGTISVGITLGANVQPPAHPMDLIALFFGSALAAGLIYLSFRFAALFSRYLGHSGTIVFLRLSSFILLCIGVQIVWSGIAAFVGLKPAA